MGKRKVIEDSDEEDGAEPTPPPQSPPKNPKHNSSSGPEHEISMALDSVQQSAGPSTASTERLHREIRNARKALVEPTHESRLSTTQFEESSQLQSPTTPSMSRSKIRRTKTAVEKPRAKRPLKTYGSQGRDVFEFHGASDGDVESVSTQPLGLQDTNQKQGQKTPGSTWAFFSGDTEVLEPRVDSTDRQIGSGSSMLPLALKSTSFEQTQGSNGNTVLKCVARLGPLESKSVDSDERTSTATMSSRDQASEPNVADNEIDPSRKRSRDEMEATNEQQTGLTEPSSSASVFSPSRTITVDKRAQTPSSPSADGVIEDPIIPRHPVTLPAAETSDDVVLIPQHVQNETVDELSLPISASDVASKSQMKFSKRSKDIDGHLEELDSDDNAIGILKDNYKPRPSKSRSGRANGEVVIPADYSKKPEAITKKKRKLTRRKTTAFHELIPKEEDEVEEDEVVNRVDFGAPASRSLQVISERDELHIEETHKAEDKQEDSQSEPEFSTVKPKESTKHRGRPRKTAITESPEKKASEQEDLSLGIEPTARTSLPRKEPEAELAEKPTESKKQRGRPKKGASDMPLGGPSAELDDEPVKHNIESVESDHATVAKKSRKKGKTTDVHMVISEELVQDSDEGPAAADDGPDVPNRVLEETQGNIMPLRTSEGAAQSPSPSKAKSAPPETPHKPGTLSKGPDRHSPISSGKVAYRVGLSKRQRIAPLLRIVRKS